jgi:predicted phage-related endonuclease
MLTPAQLIERRNRLGGSDIACLMTGDKVKIDRLWREKLGELEPENLDDNLAVQIGIATEPINLRWYERKSGAVVSRQGEVMMHFAYPWAGITLDGWDDNLDCPIEAKSVSGREPLEVIIERYQPQCQWQMEVTGANQCALSVIVLGMTQHLVEYIERDEDYAAEEVRRGAQFWRCVETRTAPVALDAVPPPADATKIYDMTGSNAWAEAAGVWRENRQGFEWCRDAEKILKSLVPADAKKCHGYLIQITRDKAGRLSLRELANE